jgi:hypothetical protein
MGEKSTTICLDSGGHKAAVHCKSQNASRLTNREDICICPAATLQVTAPLCAPGEHPPGETVAFKQARLKAVSHGSLMDASWQGKPMCVDPHDR